MLYRVSIAWGMEAESGIPKKFRKRLLNKNLKWRKCFSEKHKSRKGRGISKKFEMIFSGLNRLGCCVVFLSHGLEQYMIIPELQNLRQW